MKNQAFEALRKRVLRAMACCYGDEPRERSCKACPYDNSDCVILFNNDIRILMYEFDARMKIKDLEIARLGAELANERRGGVPHGIH